MKAERGAAHCPGDNDGLGTFEGADGDPSSRCERTATSCVSGGSPDRQDGDLRQKDHAFGDRAEERVGDTRKTPGGEDHAVAVELGAVVPLWRVTRTGLAAPTR